jgi:hypothetical protein
MISAPEIEWLGRSKNAFRILRVGPVMRGWFDCM